MKSRSNDQGAGCLILLVVVGGVALIANVPQIFFTGLFALGGIVGALFLLAKRFYRAALVALAAGAVAAAGAWVIVPAGWSQRSLLTAWQEIGDQEARLAALAPNDCTGFRESAAERKSLADWFPDWLGPRLAAAEEAWADRSVRQLTDEIDRLPAADADGLTRNRARQEALKKALASGLPAETAKRIDFAELAWAERSADELEDQFGKLAANDRDGFVQTQATTDRVVEMTPGSIRPALGGRLTVAAAAWGRRAVGAAEANLEATPPGDLAAYRQGKDGRAFLKEKFPDLQGRIADAEQAWGEDSAAAEAAKLKALPAADFAGFRDGLARRGDLVTELPDLRATLSAAASEWGGRTAALFEANVEAVPPGDRAAYGRALATAVELLQLLPEFGRRLRDAEWAWAGRSVDALVGEAEPLLAADPAAASACLRQGAADLAASGFGPLAPGAPGAEGASQASSAVAGILFQARREAVRLALEAGRRRTEGLIREDRYQAAAAEARALGEALGDEAKDVGLAADLDKLRQGCDFLANLARRANKPDPK